MSMDTAGKSALIEINKLTKFKGVGRLTDRFNGVLPSCVDEFSLISPSKKFQKTCKGLFALNYLATPWIQLDE